MQEVLKGLGTMALYIIPVAVVMLTARKLIKIPDELFRKILHFIMLGAYIPFLFVFEHWWVSVEIAVALVIILYPVLMLAGKIPAFSSFVNERKEGEFKSSMVFALGMMAFSIAIGWGVFHDKYLVLASVYAWGVGDAFAALIGKRFGRHKIMWKLADNHKSIEGCAAMFVSSAVAVFTVLMIRGGVDIPVALITSALAAFVCMIVELCTKNGLDTITCPISAMIVIIPLLKVLGG